MKSLLAAIVCIAALTGTAALASEQPPQNPPSTDRVIDGLGLLMDTPQTPVNGIDNTSGKFA